MFTQNEIRCQVHVRIEEKKEKWTKRARRTGSPRGSGKKKERFKKPRHYKDKFEERAWQAPPLQGDSLCRLGRLWRIELHGADGAFALFDEDDLIGLDVFERFDEAAG